ncbi:MAG: C10 family peptidase [Bacteroidales bacterium]|nr:C10 family peptidase [Bacteroidales bacterium]
MRKSTIILTLILVLISCKNENEFVLQECSTTVPELKKRSLQEVLDIAQNATSLLGHKSRSAESRTIDLENIQYVCTNKNSRSQSSDTLLYVVNYANDNGFAVVSANTSTTDLIAVTEKGNYNPTSESMHDNPGIDLFMDMAENYVLTTVGHELENQKSSVIKELIEVIDTTDVWIEPKLTTHWGQTGYEGTFAPNGISGCVNTALAQIMAHYEYPVQLNLTYDYAPISVLNLDWPEIKKYKGVYYDMASNSAHEAIGYLLRQLGELTDSNYESPDGTFSTSEAALTVLSELGYTVSSNLVNYETRNFYSALNNGKLIYMSGLQMSNNGETLGHAWVVDGYFERELHYLVWTKDINSPIRELLDESYTYKRYNHINWGWDGDSNGYFLDDVFNAADAVQYDRIYNFMNYNFTINLKYFLINK